MKKIIAVFKTHVDIGFTDLAENVIESYKTTMPKVVSQTCEKFGDFKWTMPSWPITKALEADDNTLADELIKKGQLVWHGLPFTTHTEFCTEEELIRGVLIAKKLSDKYNLPMPIAAKMTDVPGHTWGLVSILAKAGIKFLHLGCNSAWKAPKVPMLFWWEAKDGSRVLTFYNPTYGSSLLPPPEWKFPVWLAMQQTDDNKGPQDPELLREMVKKADGYTFEVGTLDTFYREIEPYLDDTIPVVKGDLADTWIHGVGSYPEEVGKLREKRYAIQKAEAQNTLTNNVDGKAKFDDLYERCLLFGEHTWGLDVKTILGRTRRYDKEGFESDKSNDDVQLIEKSWNEQRKRVDFEAPVEVETDFGKSDLLENDKIEVKLSETGIELFDKDTSTVFTRDGFGRVQYDIFSNDDITDFIRDCSYRFFFWSVEDFGRLCYPEVKHMTYDFKNDIIANNICKSNEQSFIKEIETKVGVHKELPYVDLTYNITKEETPLVESANIILPFNLNDDFTVEFSKTGSVVNWHKDIVKGANYGLQCVGKWINIYDGEKGVLVIPYNTPLFSVGENQVYKFVTDVYDAKPTVYINLFNNSWGTNFPQWMGGEFTFKLRLCPYVGKITTERAYEIANSSLSDFGMSDVADASENIELLSYKIAEDRQGTVLRFRSCSEENTKIHLKPKFEYKACWYSNILEENQYKFDNDISFDSKPCEIHTLYFEV